MLQRVNARTKVSRTIAGAGAREGNYNCDMLVDLLEIMPLWALGAAFAVTLIAGVVKGAIGVGLPLLIISGLSLFLDPLIAVAGMIFPAVLSNVLQVARHPRPDIRHATIEHWRYIFIVCVMILIVSQFVTRVPENALYLILGVPVVGLSVIQLMGVRFYIPPARRRAAEWGVGGVAGILGGFTGTWGPPTILYLIALETPKARQLLVQGVVYAIGSVSLLVGHVQSGLFTVSTAQFSAVLLIPLVVGMRIGFWLGDRLDPALFRKITLIVLVIAGANLVRRGLFG